MAFPRITDEELVGLWRFDGSGIEGTGLAEDISLNTGNSFVNGISGKALYYNRDVGPSSDYANMSDTITENESFSISCFFLVEEVDRNDELNSSGGIFGFGNTGNSFGIQALSTGSLGFTVRGSNTIKVLVPYNFNQIYHGCLTWDSTANKLSAYVNGEFVSSKTGDPDGLSTSIIGVLGRGLFGGGNAPHHFKGWVDECRLYFDKVLSESEVKSLYLYPAGNSVGHISGSVVRPSVKSVSGSPYTIQLDDANKFLTKTDNGNIELPDNSTIPFPVGTTVAIRAGNSTSSANISIIETGSVIIRSFDNLNTLAGANATCALIKIGNNSGGVWQLSGNLV